MTVGELKLQLEILCKENKAAAHYPVEIIAAYFWDGSPCGNSLNTFEIHRKCRKKYVLLK